MTARHVAGWVKVHSMSPSDVDCATTVMLKILDGKCKMGSVDKIVMEALYDALKHRPGERFGDEFHALIAQARGDLSESLKNFIYEKARAGRNRTLPSGDEGLQGHDPPGRSVRRPGA